MAVRLVIADDHSLVRQGLRRILESARGIEVLAEASDGAEAVALVEEHRPDVALLDVRMGEVDGLTAARAIRERAPETGVVMLTGHGERRLVLEAVRCGARGYVLKSRDAEHLIQTVRLVAEGNMVIDPDLVGAVTEELAPTGGDRPAGLTQRELEVLRLLAGGNTNREVARKLFVSPDTVKTHVEHIFQKLGTSDRTSAVAEGFRRGLLD